MIEVITRFSTYHIDTANKRICRVRGDHLPTGRFQCDGWWHDYVKIDGLDVDDRAIVYWPNCFEPTILSLTKSITEVPDEAIQADMQSASAAG